VVVGFDGSPAAGRGLQRAVGALGDSGVLVLVTVEPEVYSRGLLSEPLLEEEKFSSLELLRVARELLRTSRVGQVTVVRRGDPADVLVDVAREQAADLVVVGRRGRDFAARVLLGSVTARVVEHAPCDVLVVP
jgi:nucleotide-binding universal stress UspA family protein